MTVFSYVALKNNNDVVKGKIEASNIKEARDHIRKLNLIPTKVYEESQAKTVAKVDAKKIQTLGLQDKIDFTSTFQILTQSGIPVIEALVFMENDAAKLKIRLVAKELRRQIMAGSTFADTIAKYPKIFGQIYIGLVRAGEDSGELEKTLDRLLELLKKEAAIKSKVVGTLMYPAFVILLAMVVVTVMLVFVFPAFKDMFDNQGKPLPWITAALMSIGEFLKT
ncbi:MAG TPA: type II secretion system F family protein, partial [Candidatus Gastranaerophilaceae bacterium]|nr:type II secretion system F family protein [Candidatus Gastranaerophilaceae bacterium]